MIKLFHKESLDMIILFGYIFITYFVPHVDKTSSQLTYPFPCLCWLNLRNHLLKPLTFQNEKLRPQQKESSLDTSAASED